MSLVVMKSQWDCLRENLGEWQGSFTQISPQGELLNDTPSMLTLIEQDNQITLKLVRSPQNAAPTELIRSFRAPGPGAAIPFFDTGAFCQGSLFWPSFGQQGAELALTAGDRRLRLVQLYEDNRLSSLTLIREARANSGAVESSPLRVESLVGVWEGEAVTKTGDGWISPPSTSRLVVQQNGDRLQQTLTFQTPSGSQTLQSTAHIEGNCLRFEEGAQPVQILLLPGGASAVGPLQVQRQQPFFLEVGWLLSPTERQRLSCRYDAKGDRLGVTLVQERKLG